MGMAYNVTFYDARIPKRRYGELIGWTLAQAAADPARAAKLAFEQVRATLDDQSFPVQNADNIDLDYCGYRDGAPYGFGDELKALLALCEPGAYLVDIDAEAGSGEKLAIRVLPDGSLQEITGQTVFPGIGWPEDLNGLLDALQEPFAQFTDTQSLTAVNDVMTVAAALLAAFGRLRPVAPGATSRA